MKVRTRLVLAFSYVLILVIVVLTIPLAINLRARAKVELEKETLVNVQTIAASIGKETLKDPRALNKLVLDYSLQMGGSRVVVTDSKGIVLADSDGTAVGENFNNGLRQEITVALNPTNPTPTALTRFSTTEGHDIMVAAAPILDENRVNGVARITRNIQDVTDALHNVTVAIMLIGLMVLLAGLVIAFVMAGNMARPLTRLATAARRVGAGDLSARAGTVQGATEVLDLARSFDEMADRLERTVRSQREFVANASHQLRTPLTGMKLRLESAAADATDVDLKHQLQAADQEVDRLSHTVDRMLVMAKQIEEGEPTTVDLRAAADGAVSRWRERVEGAGGSIKATGPGGIVAANPEDLDQIVDNLVDNALAYAPGPIEILTEPSGNRLLLAVRDHGSGMAMEDRARATDRFFRGPGASGEGSGLGLAIARELTERWGGTLAVADAEGGGTHVSLLLRPAGLAADRDNAGTLDQDPDGTARDRTRPER
jgi:signal transduction histidine kinase